MARAEESSIVEIDGFDFSELCPHFAAHPHERLDQLRDKASIAWDADQQQFLSVDYAATRQLLQEATFLRDRKRARPGSAVSRTFEAAPDFVPERKNGADVLIFSDGEDHQRLRALIGAPFLARAKTARPLVEACIANALDQLSAKGPDVDMVRDFAIPAPVTVIASLLGLPDRDHAQVRQWSEDLALGFNPFRSAEEDARRWRALRAMIDYFSARLDVALQTPTEDLISDFAALMRSGAPLSRKEIVDHCIMMLTAGNLSTTDLIANACLSVLRDDALRLRLRENSSLAAAIVEESLRLDPPVTTTDRIAPGPARVGGVALCEGDVVTASLLGANNDPAMYPRAHEFDVDRETRQHLAFGAGAHICLGAPLARLEGQVALSMLFRRFPELTLQAQDIRQRPVPGHRGPEALLCRLSA